ncbi:hypothetical protein [Bacillus chungangensis]|uniref:Uncharacterized protein n=1 Tax=Bacillus chungangensis TaxID=587633 RepID=A0ABT9WY17_9BACI|nr:hypothetical protein [Bacillus chungangensis]MDQ0178122.1 hypothetical protein [Bacillus chungangensis]
MGGITFLLFYLIPIMFIVWTVLKVINLQKESNELLKKIYNQLNSKDD